MDTSLIFSIISVAIALVALLQTGTQIKLSNKQVLFDRRLTAYSHIYELLSSYSINKDVLNGEPNLDTTCRLIIKSLTENEVLRDVQMVIEQPIGQESSDKINSKLRYLNKLSDELSFIFNPKKVKELSKFIKQYKDLLKWFQCYNIQATQTKGTEFGSDYKDMLKKQITSTAKEMNETYEKIRKNETLKDLCSLIKLN